MTTLGLENIGFTLCFAHWFIQHLPAVRGKGADLLCAEGEDGGGSSPEDFCVITAVIKRPDNKQLRRERRTCSPRVQLASLSLRGREGSRTFKQLVTPFTVERGARHGHTCSLTGLAGLSSISSLFHSSGGPA